MLGLLEPRTAESTATELRNPINTPREESRGKRGGGGEGRGEEGKKTGGGAEGVRERGAAFTSVLPTINVISNKGRTCQPISAVTFEA